MSYNSFVRRGSSRLFVPRGYAEGELWAARGCFVPRRYFSMMVNSHRFGANPLPAYYLDTDVAAGGDGSIGDPWATLEESRAGLIALHSSLVTDTVNPSLICFGATDDGTAVTNTWPTSSTTYYLTIKVPDADRVGEWDASHYTYARSVDGGTSAALEIGTNSIRLQGLQLYQLINSGSNFPRPLGVSSLGGEFVGDGLKLRGSGGASNSCAFKTSGTSGRFVFRNCMTVDTLHGFLIGNPTGLGTGSEVDLYNNTSIGTTTAGGEGYQLTWAAGGSGRIARAKNNINRQRLNGISTTNEDTEDLATNSHSATGTGGAGGDFVDPTNKDFRLDATSAYKDAGTDLSGVADFPFSEDVTLYTRTGTWDQGFHEQR